MDYTEAKQRIEQLKAVLWENSRKYYVDNAPTMSDFEYDSLMHELEALEEAYPEYATEDSPTRRVGSDLEDDKSLEGGGFAEVPDDGVMGADRAGQLGHLSWEDQQCFWLGQGWLGG